MSTIYLITGAAGHLGHNLAGMLASCGERVRGLILPGERHRLPSQVEICEGNVCDKESLSDFFNTDGYDRAVLIHAAAVVTIESKADASVRNVNVQGTENVFDMCMKHHIDRVIYVSSVHAIPERPAPEVITETSLFSPDEVKGQYAKSKAAAAKLALEASERGLNLSIVHPSGIIGPGDINGRNHLMRTINAAVHGKLTAGTMGGYDLVDVRDVAAGILDCAEKGKAGECYILSGHPCTIRELLESVASIAGKKPPRLFIPLPVASAFASVAERVSLLFGRMPLYTPYSIYTLGTNYNFSHQKATAQWGYAPRPLSETLIETVSDLTRGQANR